MAGNFRVTGQRPSSRVTSDSRIEQTVLVTFETIPGGTVGSIEIPQNQYSAAKVTEIITPLATEMELVNNLGK